MNALNNKSQTESSLTSLWSGAFKTERQSGWESEPGACTARV